MIQYPLCLRYLNKMASFRFECYFIIDVMLGRCCVTSEAKVLQSHLPQPRSAVHVTLSIDDKPSEAKECNATPPAPYIES